MSTSFNNNASFSNWLDSNYWFEDGYCLKCEFDKNENSISILLAYQIKDTYVANTERTLKVFSIKAVSIKKYTSFSATDISPDHCMEGVELKESDFVSFSFDAPKIIEIECQHVVVTEKPKIIETVKPWLSETELFISVENTSLPTPNDWLSWFNKLGYNLGWRYYAGELKNTNEVPEKTYDGWYIQDIQSIPNTTQGLFFRHCKKNGSGFNIHFQRTELKDDIWNSLKQILLKFRKIEVHCGSCEFDKELWKISINEHKNG